MLNNQFLSLRIRPHHFLCMLTYAGNGYTEEFVNNFTKIIQHLRDFSTEIEIVQGPDSICHPLTKCVDHPDYHCDLEKVDLIDHQALKDLNTLLTEIPSLKNIPSPLQFGSRFVMPPMMIDILRKAFQKGTIRTACQGCDWYDFCSQEANGGFKNSKFKTTD